MRLTLLTLPALLLAGCSGEDATEAGADAQPSAAMQAAPAAKEAPVAGFYAFESRDLDGKAAPLDRFAGKVALVVNVASECGYTPQYGGLQKLQEEYAAKGLVVLGFPCNQFGGQEPGDGAAIREFCTSNYGVNFPMFEKLEVKDAGQSPIYAFLEEATGSHPNWNFCKYLVARDGSVLGFFPSKVAPGDPALREAIESAL